MLPSLWNGFLNSFAKVNGEVSVIVSILKQLYPIELTEGGLVLGCGNIGVKMYAEKRMKELEGLLSLHLKSKIKVTVVVQPKKQKATAPDAPLLTFQPSMDDVFTKAGLHAKYRFENFAVSSTNNVAFAAAQAVSKNIGASYNPLFLYGGVGVGKTHLAQSVARVALEKNPNHKVYFCPGDRFTNELIESFQDKSTARFRKKYRNLNILAIDDIQFIAGKQAVQEEFFHTFNTIVSSGGQVILTSDRPPSEIKTWKTVSARAFRAVLLLTSSLPILSSAPPSSSSKPARKRLSCQLMPQKSLPSKFQTRAPLRGRSFPSMQRRWVKRRGLIWKILRVFFNTKMSARNKRSPPTIL